MTVDCQWIEKHLEALFCDGLNEEENRVARAHIENCVLCRKEFQALNAIDPLIKKHFQRELGIARRPRVVNTARAWGLSGAAVALVAVLLFVALRAPQSSPTAPLPVSSQPQATPAIAAETPAPVKEPAVANEQVVRVKPAPGALPGATPELDRVEDRKPAAPPEVVQNAPDFAVTDTAGYSHSVSEYRGHVVVIAVWNAQRADAVANLERLYKAFAANPKFRFLGVSNERAAKPANTTFPIVYNQGSKLFGARAGDFVLLDEKGGVELKGSLVTDFDKLRRTLQAK